MNELRDFHSRLLLSIHGIAEEDLRRPEREGKWSIADVISHLGDLELIYAVRIRSMLAGTPGTLQVLPQDAWVERVHRREPLPELLEQFWFHRRMNLDLLARLSEEELSRGGMHPDYGALTIRDAFERIRNHDAKHLRQIERIQSTLGLRSSEDMHLTGIVPGTNLGEKQIAEGIRVRTLWADGVKRALEVEIDAGAAWPELDHHVPGPEEVYVLSGELGDGKNVFPAGTFVHHPAGTSHVPQSAGGCKLFVFYPEG
ncbi:MAG TPA: DinB family protein [Thermoanaerobaculia bacterium]|nr:DinB family protein [Thermoanaerobaculia bacterium]